MPEKRLKLLSISTVYPTPAEPNHGIFVKHRLDHVAKLVDVRVVAPKPAFDYANFRAGKTWINRSTESDNGVLRPQWWFPPGGGFLNPPLMAAQLLPILRRLRQSDFRFDLIDSHFAYPTGVAAAMIAERMDCPFTITLRGDETMHAEFATRARWIDWAMKRAAAIFAVSGRLRDWAICRGVSAGRVSTIPNGVDRNIFHKLPENPEPLRRRLGISGPNSRLILSVGYLIERKGHHHVVRAAKKVSELGLSSELNVAIVGEAGREDNFAERLTALTQSLGMTHRVHFLGRQSPQQVAQLMNAADLMVLASSREGWPNVVQEALACGCPVIASDIGGTPDMIPDARYGYLLPEGRVETETLAMTLQEALARKDWDRDGIAAWGSRRSWDQVALDVVTRLHELQYGNWQ